MDCFRLIGLPRGGGRSHLELLCSLPAVEMVEEKGLQKGKIESFAGTFYGRAFFSLLRLTTDGLERQCFARNGSKALVHTEQFECRHDAL